MFYFVLFRLGYPERAAHYFREALKRNKNYFPAFQSLCTTYCTLIERWHYRMLNDSYRNEAYKEAIFKKIRQGFDTVLDIGTGTGLFRYIYRPCDEYLETWSLFSCNFIAACTLSNLKPKRYTLANTIP